MQYLGNSCTRLLLLLAFGCLSNAAQLCLDRVPKCDSWKDKGLCNEHPKYKKQKFYVSMTRLCKKSCLMCGDDDIDLLDTDARCNLYLSKGYCDMKPHQGFMLRRCKYSCRNTIRGGINSPGRGNYQRPGSPGPAPVQPQPAQQQNTLSQYRNDYTNPMHWGQEYAQQYAQLYGYKLGQQQQQGGALQNDASQQNGAGQQQYAATAGQQPQYGTAGAGQQQYAAAGQQQYGTAGAGQQQYAAGQQQDASQAQQQDAMQQQNAGQQQQHPSFDSMPVTLQVLGANAKKKHKVSS